MWFVSTCRPPPGEKQKKTFRPIQTVTLSDGRAAYKRGYPKGKRSLYRRAKLEVAADTSLAVVAGGEKAADAAVELGLQATTCAGGEKAVGKAGWDPLARFDQVVISVDNDPAGETYGQLVAGALLKLKPELCVKILRLPDLPPKGDVVEWVAAGGTREQFLRLVEGTELVTVEQAKAWQAKSPKPRSDDALSNADTIEVEEDGETKLVKVALTMRELLFDLRQRTGDWPRRVGSALFVDARPEVHWLEKPPAMFGFLQHQCNRVKWRGGADHYGVSFVSRAELFEELRRQATVYQAIEDTPHEPAIEGHYYACSFSEPGDGKHLASLLDFFSLETDVDRDLLAAAIATPLWGGPAGARPAFMITSTAGRGKGKSQTAQFIGRVFGGCIDISPGEDVGVIKTRLLTPDALTRRVALLDNVKTTRFSWGELEKLITLKTISGRRLYVGEARRPNHLTWIVTLNGASLSTDMAQRVVEVKLGEPRYAARWERTVALFIDQHRDEILGDLVAFLRGAKNPLGSHGRWAEWEDEILTRTSRPVECQKLIAQRRGAVDAEEEEGEIVEDYFASKLTWLGYTPDRVDTFIPNSLVAQWYNEATGERYRTTAVTRALRQLFNEHRISKIVQARCGPDGERGFRWVGPHADVTDPTHYDIRRQLAKKLQERQEAETSETSERAF